MASWGDVRRLALALPEASEEPIAGGHAGWKVKDKLFVWERPLRPGDIAALGKQAPDGPILGARTADLAMKDMLIASDPKVFFTVPHFDGYAAVLIRLERISPKRLESVIVEAWLARASKRTVNAFLEARSKKSG